MLIRVNVVYCVIIVGYQSVIVHGSDEFRQKIQTTPLFQLLARYRISLFFKVKDFRTSIEEIAKVVAPNSLHFSSG